MFLFFSFLTAFAEPTTKLNDELVIPTQAVQQKASPNKKGKGKKKGKKRKKKAISIPIEIGVGPAGYHFGSMNGADRTLHSAVSISAQAIISQKLIRQNKHMIPKQYRKMALAQKEMRISKIWIPESIIISPSVSGTSAMGLSFRPISASIIRPKRNKGLGVDLGARVTYAYIKSPEANQASPHFLGLGIDGKAEYRVKLSKKNGVGIGWASHIYIPQAALSGGEVTLSPSDWHVGQAFVKYYYRFPYKYKP